MSVLSSIDDTDFEEYGVSRKTAVEVFQIYFRYYEQATGEKHPYLKSETVRSIVSKIPYLYDDEKELTGYLETEDYKVMIEQHFNTPYKNCDYNIAHFFSGDIRQNRFYETLY